MKISAMRFFIETAMNFCWDEGVGAVRITSVRIHPDGEHGKRYDFKADARAFLQHDHGVPYIQSVHETTR